MTLPRTSPSRFLAMTTRTPLKKWMPSSEQCSKGVSSSFIPTKIQMPEFLKMNKVKSFKGQRMIRRFDNYMWLPVNPSTGAVLDYDAEHFGVEYTPMPKFLEWSKSGVQNQTVLFTGASHNRYIFNQVSKIYYNLTYGVDGCREELTIPPSLDNSQTRFNHMPLRFVDEWMGHPLVPPMFSQYDKYVVTIGHWDAGWFRSQPTPPGFFLDDILPILNILETNVKAKALKSLSHLSTNTRWGALC